MNNQEHDPREFLAMRKFVEAFDAWQCLPRTVKAARELRLARDALAAVRNSRGAS